MVIKSTEDKSSKDCDMPDKRMQSLRALVTLASWRLKDARNVAVAAADGKFSKLDETQLGGLNKIADDIHGILHREKNNKWPPKEEMNKGEEALWRRVHRADQLLVDAWHVVVEAIDGRFSKLSKTQLERLNHFATKVNDFLRPWAKGDKAQSSKEKWCAHCKTDCPERKPDDTDVEKLRRAVASGDKLLQRVHDLLGVVVRDSRADDEMCIEMSNFADEVWEHLHRDDKRGPKDESGAVK